MSRPTLVPTRDGYLVRWMDAWRVLALMGCNLALPVFEGLLTHSSPSCVAMSDACMGGCTGARR